MAFLMACGSRTAVKHLLELQNELLQVGDSVPIHSWYKLLQATNIVIPSHRSLMALKGQERFFGTEYHPLIGARSLSTARKQYLDNIQGQAFRATRLYSLWHICLQQLQIVSSTSDPKDSAVYVYTYSQRPGWCEHNIKSIPQREKK